MSDIGMILTKLGKSLVTDVAPALEGDYRGGMAGMIGLMSVMAGEAWDGAADRLWREIEGMKALLVAAGDEEAGEITPASLTLSELSLARNELAERLIGLHVALERREDEAARTLLRNLWAFLLSGASERMPSPPDFAEPE